jgi:hypothetical protein
MMSGNKCKHGSFFVDFGQNLSGMEFVCKTGEGTTDRSGGTHENPVPIRETLERRAGAHGNGVD